jgi:hypothetical protein
MKSGDVLRMMGSCEQLAAGAGSGRKARGGRVRRGRRGWMEWGMCLLRL